MKNFTEYLNESNINKINGNYIMFSDGGGWEYFEIKNNKIIGNISKYDMGSSIAARDKYSFLKNIDIEKLPIITNIDKHNKLCALLCPECNPEAVTFSVISENLKYKKLKEIFN